jgi:hypothetical protein
MQAPLSVLPPPPPLPLPPPLLASSRAGLLLHLR